MTEVAGQGEYRIRFDWGQAGASALVPGAAAAVVVDVLTFTTTLTVAVEAGATVYPHPWDPVAALGYATARDATVAVGRSRARPGQPSLSPVSIRGVEHLERLVLPSPNGSALAFTLADGGAAVVGACLRNATAVADWITSRGAGPVAVIAAGERWPDGGPRPAVEDLLGAGAVLSVLAVHDRDGCSPEALAAAAAFLDAQPVIDRRLRECVSGRELVAKGFADDVRVAAELDVSAVVPVLRGPAFVDARSDGEGR